MIEEKWFVNIKFKTECLNEPSVVEFFTQIGNKSQRRHETLKTELIMKFVRGIVKKKPGLFLKTIERLFINLLNC